MDALRKRASTTLPLAGCRSTCRLKSSGCAILSKVSNVPRVPRIMTLPYSPQRSSNVHLKLAATTLSV